MKITSKTFTIAEGKQDDWYKSVANNQDPYGFGVMEFSAKWANLMEERMVDGSTVADVAENAEREADTDRITGFMYGCAVATLATVWVPGQALRRWSNLKIQIGKEGEKANESGGVLNPALLSIG